MNTRATKTAAQPSGQPPLGPDLWLNAMNRAGFAWYQGFQEVDQCMIDYIESSVNQAENYTKTLSTTRDLETLTTLSMDFAITKWGAICMQALALAQISRRTGEAMQLPILEALTDSTSPRP